MIEFLRLLFTAATAVFLMGRYMLIDRDFTPYKDILYGAKVSSDEEWISYLQFKCMLVGFLISLPIGAWFTFAK